MIFSLLTFFKYCEKVCDLTFFHLILQATNNYEKAVKLNWNSPQVILNILCGFAHYLFYLISEEIVRFLCIGYNFIKFYVSGSQQLGSCFTGASSFTTLKDI